MGTKIQGNIEAENLTKLNVSASINEYQWDTSKVCCSLDFEQHTIHLEGIAGSSLIYFGTKNFVSEFESGSRDKQVFLNHTIHDTDELGLGFYFWHPSSKNFSSAIEQLHPSDGYLRFGHVYEPFFGMDYLSESEDGAVNYNIYSRDPLLFSSSNEPINLEWIIEKKGIVEDPNVDTDGQGQNLVQLNGEYAIWNIKIKVNETQIDLANYYIQEDYASYLNSEVPLSLGQFYSSPNFNLTNIHRSNIEFTDFAAESEDGEEYCIEDWQISKAYLCSNFLPEAIEHRFGWIEQNDHLTSVAGHSEDLEAMRTIGQIVKHKNETCITIPNMEIDETVLKISIYPNPTYDFVSFKTQNNENYHFTLLDSSGKVLFYGDTKEKLDLSKFPTNLYFIVFTDKLNKGKSIHKIVKN